jgi:hypothetical protein
MTEELGKDAAKKTAETDTPNQAPADGRPGLRADSGQRRRNARGSAPQEHSQAWECGRCRMSSEMELAVDAGGGVRCVYGEELDLREIGRLQITWASHVEPDRDGFWWADMGPVDGPVRVPSGTGRRHWRRSVGI